MLPHMAKALCHVRGDLRSEGLNMKRSSVLCLFVVLAMTIAIAACGGNSVTTQNPQLPPEPPPPPPTASSCDQWGTIPINNGEYIYQQNEWNSSASQCATVSGVGFSLTTSNFNLPNGAPATYPSIYKGCHWGNCSTNSGMPIKVSNIGTATSIVNITTAPGDWDAAYDIWFNTTSTTSGQPDGTEVMIWVNHQGFPNPFGGLAQSNVQINGANWDVWTGHQAGWNIISYVRQPGATSANLDLKPFFSDAVSRGSLDSSWWLIDVEMGFEVWTKGQGLGISNLQITTAAQ
jgi:Glycosyl hydrolase family 12